MADVVEPMLLLGAGGGGGAENEWELVFYVGAEGFLPLPFLVRH